MIKRKDGDRARWYEVREGVWYKSYTTVLSMMPSSPWLIKWLKEHTKEESDQLFTDAGLQGSKVHHAIDLILKGEEVFPTGIKEDQINKEGLHEEDLINYLKKPFSEKEDTMIRGFLNFYKDYNLKMIRSEFTVYSDKIKCAGTMDFFGKMDLPVKGKKTDKKASFNVIIDWKTGKSIHESHFRQVSGYYVALRDMIHDKILTSMPMPKRAFLLHLGVNKCGYKLIEIENIKEQYKRFLRVNDEWNDANPNAKPDEEYEYLLSYKI